MADYSGMEEAMKMRQHGEDGLVRKDPLAYARKMVLGQAEELHKQFQDFEELIAVKGRELDLLCKARDTLGDALRGTEAVRVEINEALEGPRQTEDTSLNPGRF
jgi:hypothetical protein